MTSSIGVDTFSSSDRKNSFIRSKQPSIAQSEAQDKIIEKENACESNSNLQVFIRIRPFLYHEDRTDCPVNIDEKENIISINESNYQIQQNTDKVFGESSTQVYVFDHFLTPISKVLDGYNFTVFAYGQTGSGKTYTMFGADWESLIHRQENVNLSKKQQQQTFLDSMENDENFAGVIPRTIYELFKQVAAKKNEYPLLQIQVYCSFLQIYNEKVFDLLQEGSAPKQLNIHESKMDGIFVEGLSEFETLHYLDTLQLMKRGEKNRAIRTTSMNTKSSRSHTIFQLIVETLDTSKESGTIKRSRINLCDLAGSEKINKQEAMVGGHFNELRNINLSLTTLGKVIHNLSKNSKMPIPFRESKLTRILQESLVGNTQTYIIANISPNLHSIDDTVSTLKFAERARHITVQIKPNLISAKDDENMKKLRKEVLYLKEILNLRRKGQNEKDIHSKFLKLQEENEKLKKDHISIREVEKLISENRLMKQEIQQIYMNQIPQKPPSAEASLLDKPVENFGESSMLSKRFSTPNLLSPVLNSTQASSMNVIAQTDLLPILKSRSNERIAIDSNSHYFQSSNLGRNLMLQRQTSRSSNVHQSLHAMGLMDKNTPVNIRIRGKQDYSMKSGFIEVSQAEVTAQERQQKEKRRILERLDLLERIQKFNSDRLSKELRVMESIEQNQKSFKFPSANQSQIPSRKNSPQQVEFAKQLAPLVQKQKKQIVNYENKIKELEKKYFSNKYR